jgi:hypothetical protein
MDRRAPQPGAPQPAPPQPVPPQLTLVPTAFLPPSWQPSAPVIREDLVVPRELGQSSGRAAAGPAAAGPAAAGRDHPGGRAHCELGKWVGADWLPQPGAPLAAAGRVAAAEPAPVAKGAPVAAAAEPCAPPQDVDDEDDWGEKWKTIGAPVAAAAEPAPEAKYPEALAMSSPKWPHQPRSPVEACNEECQELSLILLNSSPDL